MSTLSISQPQQRSSPVAAPAPAALSPSSAPSPWLPGVHFAGALAFFASACVGLALVAPDLARGSFSLPRVVAVVHLFVLGWIIPSIFGALCQFLPVAVGQQLKWPRLAYTSFAAHALGLALFVYALVSTSRPLLYWGAGLLSFSFAAFTLNLVASLLAAKERTLTYWALLGSSLFLLATPAYGVALAMNLFGDTLLGQRFTTVAIHAHVALVGIVLLVMVGVAHRLLPMFLLSHGAKERAGWVSVGLLFAGALLLALPAPWEWRVLVGALLSAAGVVAFLIQSLAFFHHRKRKVIDPGMLLAAAGLVGLLVALLLAPWALTRGTSAPQLLVTYFAVLLGAISLFVAGHYFKIVPFIVWYHRFGPLVGLQKVPKVAELYSERAASIVGGLLIIGWLGVAAAIFSGSPWTLRIAALIFLAGAWGETVIIVRIAQRRAA